MMDQRHVVGMARFALEMADRGIVAIHHIGMHGDTGRRDNHGHGLSIDLGGMSKAPPERLSGIQPVRIGVDFHIFFHWGRVHMFNPTSVASHRSNRLAWQRFQGPENFDDGRNYEQLTVQDSPLEYRLDPPPYMFEPIDTPDQEVRRQLEQVVAHFAECRDLFRAAYEFFAREYSDSPLLDASGNPVRDGANNLIVPLGRPQQPAPPMTQINSQVAGGHDGHLVIHPDYPEPNSPGGRDGRGAHANHIHAQLGPTTYTGARRQ